MTYQDHSVVQSTVITVQQRWGSEVLHTFGPLFQKPVPYLATGFARLDLALGIGGFPRGHLTEFSGMATSGMGTLALKAIAQAHANSELAAYLDLPNTFDADYAIRCGVEPSDLLVVRPSSPVEAIDMASTLVSTGGASVIVADLSCAGRLTADTDSALRRLSRLLVRSGCVFIILSSSDLLGNHQAALRLQIKRERWLYRNSDVSGYRAQITILKNKFAPVCKPASIVIGFSSSVHGDGA